MHPRVRISCVIPALNEELNIGWVLERIPPSVDEVIVVDGDSVDATIAVGLEVRPDLRIVDQTMPGKGAALRAGFEAANGDVIVMIDADRSMDPAEIDGMLERLDEGYDIVKGSRFTAGGGTDDMGPVRRCGNAVLRGIVNSLYDADFTDLCYGYMAFRRDALHRLELSSDGFEIETEIVVRALTTGLRMAETPSFEARRAYGKSNLRTWRDGRRVLATMLRGRSARVAARSEPPALEIAPSPTAP